ncbi:MAG: ABC transporter permease, partial [Holophagales bacterium]|nr:ABC transporter permease [Holophagales bacterium]
ATLVVAEVTACVILLAGAGLLARSFGGFLAWQPGFDTERLATTWLVSSTGKYPQGEAVARLHVEAARRVEALPSVERAGLVSAGPLFGGRETGTFRLAGAAEDGPAADIAARWFDVGPGYLATLGLPTLHGRPLGPEDRAGTPGVAVLNQTFARRIAAGGPIASVVGERIAEPSTGRSFEVVGVVADIAPLEPGAPTEPEIYWPYLQRPRWAAHLVIRARGDPELAFDEIRQRLGEVAPHLGKGAYHTLDQLRDRRLVEPRFSLSLVGLFAAVALVLAAIGLYGVLAYSVVRRQKEIAIRVALGERPSRIRSRLIAIGSGLTLLGIALGLSVAAALGRFLSSLLHGVPATDPATYLTTGAFFLSVALAACYLPARRASRIDPASLLRGD